MKYLAFLIYISLWDGGILIGAFYVTFILGNSNWWWLGAFFLMSISFQPRQFGIQQFPSLKEFP